LLAIALFVRGSEGYAMSQWRKAAFITAILGMVVALISPLDAMSAALFSAHMLQHLLLMLLAAPLWILSRPIAPLLRALPLAWAHQIGVFLQRPILQKLWQRLSHLGSALFLHLFALWIWHLPMLYELALVNGFAHALEHASFFGTAALFFQALYRSADFGLRLLSVFVVMMASGLLGALMTFANSVWYSAHAAYSALWGLSPLEDQQLAGLFMWIPPGFIYVLLAALLLAAWINHVEARTLQQERLLAKELSDA
jgi:putative membrane protein